MMLLNSEISSKWGKIRKNRIDWALMITSAILSFLASNKYINYLFRVTSAVLATYIKVRIALNAL